MVISAIMRKMLKLSNSARKKFTMGQITNLVSVDAQRLLEASPWLCVLWSAPYQVIPLLFYLYHSLQGRSIVLKLGGALLCKVYFENECEEKFS